MSKTKSTRRMPIKTAEIELDGDYAGWTMTIRTNVRFGQFMSDLTTLSTLDENSTAQSLWDAMVNLLEGLIINWNFVDEKGAIIPVSREGFGLLPIDLLALACGKAQGVITQSPLASSKG